MLTATAALGVGFRAHVKSHKTLQLSKLQVGADIDRPAAFVVSTLIEAENLLPYLRECEAQGRKCSASSPLIYGVPIPLSSVPRLVRLAQKLKPGTIAVLIDNQSAFLALKEQLKTQNEALHTLGKDALSIGVYIKVDTGYHRAGIQTSSPKFKEQVDIVIAGCGKDFRGFYSHFGHSYAGSSEEDAANGLLEELQGLEEATRAVPDPAHRLTLSVGATPTATATQNMLASNAIPAVAEFKRVIQRLQDNHDIEFHAGVYPLLDLQQVATQARPSAGDPRSGFEPLATSSIAIKMLVEVTSVYDEREKPEALVSAGSLALGREPCKSYPGWGIVTGDLGNAGNDKIYDAQGNKTGWIVGRVSQEHGILTWEGPKEEMTPLKVGDRLLIWPNHACVAGAGFGWYAIVDSERDATEIVDIWVRWRGW
ncbi:putative serine dehydratase domain-domain-containing protein [Clohesyomyces aquaticus]|uniref:Putative serine dehydratase domain-domain-containing protein n=1 Tax=Clohesyomyces aquaticus TaxID=1231657 RepID=A0A1Y1Z873_9PLEO|nr:putative serine dehydratase domain-domain-containing protein [Clohesyomyces aquaticus]